MTMSWPLSRPAPASCRYELAPPAHGGPEIWIGEKIGRDSGAGHVAWDWSARGAYTNLVRPCLATYDYPYRPWLATCDLPYPTRAPPHPTACEIRLRVQHLARTACSYSDTPRLVAIDCIPAHSTVVCVVDLLHASCCPDSWVRTLPWAWATHQVVLLLVLFLGRGQTLDPCSFPDYCSRLFKQEQKQTKQNKTKL